MKDFWFSSKKFRTFSKKCSANLSTLHSTHPDSFSETKVFFWSNKSIFQFFSKVDRKSCRFWEENFQRSGFPEEISPEKRFLEKCPWVFFGHWANRISEFCKSFQHGGWGVRKTIHVSRVPFGGKLVFGTNIYLLIEKWQIMPTVSDVSWELLSMVVKLHFSCREE